MESRMQKDWDQFKSAVRRKFSELTSNESEQTPGVVKNVEGAKGKKWEPSPSKSFSSSTSNRPSMETASEKTQAGKTPAEKSGPPEKKVPIQEPNPPDPDESIEG